MFIWYVHLTGHPVFLFARSANPRFNEREKCANGWMHEWQRKGQTQICSQILLQSLSHYRNNSHPEYSTCSVINLCPVYNLSSKGRKRSAQKLATYKITDDNGVWCLQADLRHGAWKVMNPQGFSPRRSFAAQQQHVGCKGIVLQSLPLHRPLQLCLVS